MKFNKILIALGIVAAPLMVACEDDQVSEIGSSITTGEASITIDSTTYNLNAVAVVNDNYDARTGNLMFGNISVPEYGDLKTSFVSRMMCLTSLPLTDSIPASRVDSVKLRMIVSRDLTTGDSLLPQQVTVYRLTKQLPSGISNAFDPQGYYDQASKLGQKSFTTSSIGNRIYVDGNKNPNYVAIDVDMPRQLGVDLFDRYKKDPSIFAWPQTFAQYFPGLFVESSFGKGCVANVAEVDLWTYFWHPATKKVINDKDTTVVAYNKVDSVCLLSATPEVLSSNNIKYTVAQSIKDDIAAGKIVITTPGGYYARITLPARQIIAEYNNQQHNLSIISALSMSIPASTISNDFNIGAAPYMLMIKTSEIDEFFRNNRIPDNKTSFYAEYDAYRGRYAFNSLRTYILNLIDKGTVDNDDVDFTLVPVNVSGETEPSYGGSTYYITKCVPYMLKPTMTLVDTQNAQVVFTFSSQLID